MRDSFIFYRSFFEAINDLDDMQQLEIYKAVANYSLNFVEPDLKGVSATIFKLIKPQLEANNKRFLNGTQPKSKHYESKTEAKQKQVESKTEANSNNNVNNNVNNNEKNKGYSIEFEKAWEWYNENTTRPTGDKKKAYSSYLKQLKIIPHREINGAIYNYVMECKKSNTFTKHLVSFLNGDLEQYLNRNRNTKIETKPTYNYTEDGTMICKPEFKYESGL